MPTIYKCGAAVTVMAVEWGNVQFSTGDCFCSTVSYFLSANDMTWCRSRYAGTKTGQSCKRRRRQMQLVATEAGLDGWRPQEKRQVSEFVADFSVLIAYLRQSQNKPFDVKYAQSYLFISVAWTWFWYNRLYSVIFLYKVTDVVWKVDFYCFC